MLAAVGLGTLFVQSASTGSVAAPARAPVATYTSWRVGDGNLAAAAVAEDEVVVIILVLVPGPGREGVVSDPGLGSAMNDFAVREVADGESTTSNPIAARNRLCRWGPYSCTDRLIRSKDLTVTAEREGEFDVSVRYQARLLASCR